MQRSFAQSRARMSCESSTIMWNSAVREKSWNRNKPPPCGRNLWVCAALGAVLGCWPFLLTPQTFQRHRVLSSVRICSYFEYQNLEQDICHFGWAVGPFIPNKHRNRYTWLRYICDWRQKTLSAQAAVIKPDREAQAPMGKLRNWRSPFDQGTNWG